MILDIFKDNPAVKSLLNKDKQFCNNSIIEEALVIASYFKLTNEPIVIVKNNLYNAQRLFERLNSLLPNDVLLYSVEESLRVESIAASPENMANKIEVLYSVLNNSNKIIVTHIAGVIRYLPRVSLFKDRIIDLKVDQEISIDRLKEELLKSGYTQVSYIDRPLCFAQRGGIIDFYSMNNEHPVRIEFFDTIIDSIRYFDINTQKTIKQINDIKCIPASDILFSDEDINEIENKVVSMLNDINNDTLTYKISTDLDYIKNNIKENYLYSYYSFLSDVGNIFDYIKNPLIIVENDNISNNYLHKLIEDITSYVQEMAQEKKMLPKFSLMHDYKRLLNNKSVIKFNPFSNNISQVEELDLPKENLANLLKILLKNEKRILMMLNETEINNVISECVNNNIEYNLIIDDEEIKDGINIYFGYIFQGFRANIEDLCVVSSLDLFENKSKLSRYFNKFKNAQVINNHQELNVGDYIVHNTHGVGQYMGLETKVIQGIHRDYLKVIYRGNVELLIPLEQFRLIRKFVSREGVIPKLNKLGSNEWENTKSRIKESINNLAKRLVSLYSLREKDIGYAYKEDSIYQKEFEDSFEFNLTHDQEIAVNEIKKDMQSEKPMDRLLCGDVGFGKTEVAIRAAFKAVSENKQVAFLCPTTILSNQHYKTFKKRFSNYPVNLEVLNRYVVSSKQKEVVKDLKEGKVDIIIGTHRLLSNDVNFKDLGLLIIDEEQRFGVEHKEKIKELKSSIDVLSLSATPIPRTLQMSLVGVRQLSQLETPPDNRYPVQTYVVEKNSNLIKEVIERELSRNGQVFYLYNNVDEIYSTARKVQKLVKDAKVMVAHGKMNKEEIEDVMLKFTLNEVNVLICTTIIETGIDIPNANTIIIENADRFGLSQLYQIKGRVGRSDKIAYAYLMVPERKQLSEIASKRLQAIKEFATLGSGYKIAMRDLTIRGAGDMLGPDQSGFIDTVGIDMYIEMLEEAIKKEKGEEVVEKVEKDIVNVSVDSYIPEKFTTNDYDKISIYKDIDNIESIIELEKYKEKIIDEYGKLPKVVSSLFDKKKLDILVSDKYVEKYKEIKGASEIIFSKEFSDVVDGVKLFEIFTNISKDISIRYIDGRIIAKVLNCNDKLNLVFKIIEQSKGAIK